MSLAILDGSISAVYGHNLHPVAHKFIQCRAGVRQGNNLAMQRIRLMA
jgi:hypothetical protein